MNVVAISSAPRSTACMANEPFVRLAMRKSSPQARADEYPLRVTSLDVPRCP